MSPLVASMLWDQSSELHQLQGEVVESLGYPHTFFQADEPVPQDAAIVLVQGPYGSLQPLVNQLLASPREYRPALAYWFQQSLHMSKPAWLRPMLAGAFSGLRRTELAQATMGKRYRRATARVLDRYGYRWRFVGDIQWLHQHGLLDVLALSSSVYAADLATIGIDAIVVPRGFHPTYGAELGIERDIAVVWMGKTRTRRRREVVYGLREQLAARGLEMHIHDNVDRAFIFGEERTQVLNRTAFVLNVHTNPVDELSIRFVVAAANGAVVLTEPNANDYPFVAGEHWVEAQIEAMPDVVAGYMQHPEPLRAIAANMRRLMETDLTLQGSVAQILAKAEHVLAARRAEAGDICEIRSRAVGL